MKKSALFLFESATRLPSSRSSSTLTFWKIEPISTNSSRYYSSRSHFTNSIKQSSLLKPIDHIFKSSQSLSSSTSTKPQEDLTGFEVEYDKIISTLPRVPKQSYGRTFIDVWMLKLQLDYKHKIPPQKIHWPSLIVKCISTDRSMNELNFGGILMMFCAKNDAYQIAAHYMNWEKNPTLATLSGFLRICTELRDPNQSDYISLLLGTYEKIKAKCGSTFDRETGDRCISALSKTNRWKEGLEILEATKIGGPPLSSSYCAIASAAFRNGQFDLGWEQLHQIGYRSLPEEPLIAWLNHCSPKEENILKVLEFMNLYEHYATSKLIKEIQYFFESKLKYKGVHTSIIPRRGVCKNCLHPMERSVLTEQEFEKLRDHFFTKVLVTSDVFLNTTPQELERYKKFIEDHSSYDFILDGLNIALSCGRSGPGGKSPAFVLELFVENLYRAGFKTLVLGRNHMTRWHKGYMDSIRSMADIYLIEDQSQDDPFLIWATFKSGMKAEFVSKDFMRNHTFKLRDPEMARLFKRWRLSRQKNPLIQIRGNQGNIRLEPFAEIVPMIQKSPDSSCWHIPYDLERIVSPYDIPSRWLCLTHNRFRK